MAHGLSNFIWIHSTRKQPAGHLALLLLAAFVNQLLSHSHGYLLGLVTHGRQELGHRFHRGVLIHLHQVFYQQPEGPQSGFTQGHQHAELVFPLRQLLKHARPAAVFEQQQRQLDHTLPGEPLVREPSNFVHHDLELG